MEQDAFHVGEHFADKETSRAPSHYLRLLKSHNPHLGSRSKPKSEKLQHIGFDSRVAAAVGLSELAATEQCPHCSRRFSREAAARHVPICAGLKSRPKPPREPMVYFTDQLGRRQASPKGPKVDSFAVPRSMVWPEAPEAQGSLKQQWSLVQFLLRDGLEALADDGKIIATARRAEESMEFLETLEDYSMRLGMEKGDLARFLLPETDGQAVLEASLPSNSRQLDGITERERQELVQRSVALRRLVRVKVADGADVEQAHESLRLIVEFLDALQRAAAEERRSLTSILRDL
ncbi:unnamed protein product [Durusdinium trenchii]|uniref:C2HC/C3H-type domain-containing protein n=1 Tax=Durusdinium trenchii TaxID=1381693 RepID=A0ABP0LR71_9DINO